MAMILQPGIIAPDFSLPAVHSYERLTLNDYPDQKLVLVFFPAGVNAELNEQLQKFQAKEADFTAQGARLIGISHAGPELLQNLNLTFPLVSDSVPHSGTASKYGNVSAEEELLPAVFVLDEERLIRRVYEPAKYPMLPNPAMVIRALKKLADLPKPPPVTADDWHLGPLDAPVTVLEYADYECQPCGEAYRLLRQIIPTYSGKILWAHRHLPLRHSHPLAQQAAEAAEAAGSQGKFWEMHDRLFEARGAVERANLIKYAAEIGLDMEKFTEDLDERRFREAVNADFKVAVSHKIKLPPALFTNGLPLEGPRTETNLRAIIENLLACLRIN